MEGTVSFLLFIILLGSALIFVPVSMFLFFIFTDSDVLNAMKKSVIQYIARKSNK